MKKVLLAERHAITRDGIRYILQRTGEYQVVRELSDGDALIVAAKNESFDVAIVDLTSLGNRSIELISQLVACAPKMRILALCSKAEPTRAKSVFCAGASGFVTKDSTAAELVQAIHAVLAGHKYMSAQVAECIVRTIDIPPDAPLHTRLTEREGEVLKRLAYGDGISDIAKDLGLNSKTISTYKARLLAKLDLRNDAALIRYAIEQQIIEPD
ncbi:response regulator transcription factor [Burkholderia vietnamiensis]|uniref:Two component transcriptional regulator, LuxR family n=2 Tax=Burkholderia vietnamiensis TaxID=60552 RepID=A4JSJ3_BURVG|nr:MULTISPECIES: response regulator transcription factor [Burkholderia]ABO59246.1 two component transcriptional regulator, LuxR family [Burkholderia vietnamiensis G4]TPQ48565.1 DNA-binding response regulator [Burkholderia ubonensis]AOJ16932.1 two-component system response regulator [Burkholderia vietnamiensis]AOK44479.1 two-component system response regulator [Burkholderia vietnamiensis]KVE21465.1 two-component system response regulator [Burkholderia vietnamiensis]